MKLPIDEDLVAMRRHLAALPSSHVIHLGGMMCAPREVLPLVEAEIERRGLDPNATWNAKSEESGND